MKKQTIMLPKSVLLICIGEFAERFAFYGLSALCPLLLLGWGLSEDLSTAVLSLFRCVAYFSPVIGSVVADGVLGKYKTIVLGMSLYAVAMLMATGFSMLDAHWPFIASLVLVGIATGFVKSVVGALLGEQVAPDERAALERAFTIFYSSIQCGSLMAFVVTPLIRVNVPMPFSFLAALSVLSGFMLVSMIVFAAGKRWYILKSSRGAELVRFVRLCFVAAQGLVGWIRGRTDMRELLVARGFSAQEIDDAKSCVSVFYLFVLVFPVFFSVLEQQGSRWVFQVMKMDRRVPFTQSLMFPPEMTGIYNPVLVLVCVPIFAFLLKSVELLRRILMGLLLGVGGMVTSAVLEVFVAAAPYQVSFLWQLPQYVLICASEVLVYSIALQFFFQEAPEKMKSIFQAFLLLTISAGNLLLGLLSLLSSLLDNQVLEYFLYSVFLLGATVLFFFLSRNYQYRQPQPKLEAELEILGENSGDFETNDQEDLIK